MIVKVQDGNFKTRYYSGDGVETRFMPIDMLLNEPNNVIGLIRDIEGLQKNGACRADSEHGLEINIIGSDGKIKKSILTFDCGVYIMNENGKTIDKYMGIIHINK